VIGYGKWQRAPHMSRTRHNDRSLFPLLACREQLRVKGLRLKQLESERAKHREGREALEAQVRSMGVELKTPCTRRYRRCVSI
jgi:hypothetical protein